MYRQQENIHKEPTIEPQPGKRYRYCCRKCKHSDKGKKTCVCVVPKSQRRLSIRVNGCKSCGCMGCSIQDFLSRGEDPEYRPEQPQKEEPFDSRNGCCRKCMKAFSHNGKSCLCQVPQAQRNTPLDEDGCKICGCAGCHPQDVSPDRFGESNSSMESLSSVEYIDEDEYNLDNVQKSLLGRIVAIEYHLVPQMLGLGIPQRSHSYILGRPQPKEF